jgi:Flp pilus assembly CpaF family ATPase
MTEDVQPSARDEQARRLAETLRRQLGATLCGLMQTSDVVELMLNPDGRVWVDRLGKGMSLVCTIAAATAESLIATVASTIRSTVTRESPILECELPPRLLWPDLEGLRASASVAEKAVDHAMLASATRAFRRKRLRRQEAGTD